MFISTKGAIAVAIGIGLVFIFLYFYIGFTIRKHLLDESVLLARETSINVAHETELYLAPALKDVRTRAELIITLKNNNIHRNEIVNLIKSSITIEKNYLAQWIMMEPNAYDNKDHLFKNNPFYDANGSMSFSYFKHKNSTILEVNNPNDFNEDYYTTPKRLRKELIIEPYLYTYHGYNHQFFETSAIAPIIENSKFLGVVGIDLDLDSLQNKLSRIRPYKTGFLTLVTSKGKIVSHYDTSLINNSILDYLKVKNLRVLSTKELTQQNREIISEFTGKKVYRLFQPIDVGKELDPWLLMVEIPIEDIFVREKEITLTAAGTLIIGFCLVIFLVLNIFDRRRNEQSLQEAIDQADKQMILAQLHSKKYSEIFNSTNEAIIIHDAKTGEIIDVNNSMLEVFGYESLTQLITSPLSELSSNISPYTYQGMLALISQAVALGSVTTEWQSKKRNNTLFWTEISYKSSEIGNQQRVLAVIRDITSRKHQEEELTQSRQLFETLATMAPVGIYRCNLEGEIIYKNTACSEILGISNNQGFGKNWIQLIHPDDKERVLTNWDKFLKGTEDSAISEHRYIKQNGDSVYTLVHLHIELTNGVRSGFIGTITDITPIKIAQEQMALSEKKFRELAELLPQPVWETNLNGNFTYVNKSALQLFKYEYVDIINKFNVAQTIVHNDRERAIQNISAIMFQGASSIGHEYTGVDKDGHQFPIRVFSSPITENGKTTGLRGVIFDMTEVREAERELRESEERYKTILEAFSDIVMLTNSSDEIIFANEALERITGISPAQYKTTNRAAHILPEDIHLLIEAKNALNNSETNHSKSIEYRFIDIWGEQHWFNASISKLWLQNELIYQIIMRDITQRRKIEKELERYQLNLEMLVKERTEELEKKNQELKLTNEALFIQQDDLEQSLSDLKKAQEQLIQSEKMASLGVLSAGIAHEINNPLNYINGGILGIKEYISEHLNEHLINIEPLINAVDIGIERAADIVKSLGRFSRQTDSTNEICSINAIIDSCLIILHNEIKNRISVTKDYSLIEIKTIGNEGKLHQAILNILSNAIHAVNDDGLINIKTESDSKMATITISDNGHGIAKENLTKIFDPFFTTKEPGKGTGLGLAITYQIINEMNGTIEFISELNRGTTVIIKMKLLSNIV